MAWKNCSKSPSLLSSGSCGCGSMVLPTRRHSHQARPQHGSLRHSLARCVSLLYSQSVGVRLGAAPATNAVVTRCCLRNLWHAVQYGAAALRCSRAPVQLLVVIVEPLKHAAQHGAAAPLLSGCSRAPFQSLVVVVQPLGHAVEHGAAAFPLSGCSRAHHIILASLVVVVQPLGHAVEHGAAALLQRSQGRGARLYALHGVGLRLLRHRQAAQQLVQHLRAADPVQEQVSTADKACVGIGTD